ncbi:chaperone protein DnaJ [Rhizoctonia solani 123E]|uniref:Chaperone protein DnaJ n=1 Tax=Rhizoctonia solani 123E TaxID=1423351 RepID=A0A074SQL5_9AGAM|nr:chaperone protein DnaJ [Rhizoctonia solani 123E]
MAHLALFTLFSIFCALVAVVAAGSDYYKTLGVDRHASDATIKKAYKKQSKKYHPDKNTTPEAKDKFVEVSRAYEVLSDSEKRAIYDRHGEEGLKQHEAGRNAPDPFNMFSNFFGGQQEQSRKGPTMLTEFEVSLADMYSGNHVGFRIKKRILCDHCRGSGAASDGDIHTCGGCNGQGVKLVKQQVFPGMYAQTQVTCNECGGRGKVIKKVCPHCHGHKVVDHTAEYTLDVTPGMPEGHEVVFEGEADESPDYDAGDVVLRVRSGKTSGGFRRKESSLYWTETIGVDEALLGFEHNITHLDGRIVTLKKDGTTQPGHVQVVEGEGMPIFEGTGHGDLFVTYNVVLPTTLGNELKQKLSRAFARRAGAGPEKDETEDKEEETKKEEKGQEKAEKEEADKEETDKEEEKPKGEKDEL